MTHDPSSPGSHDLALVPISGRKGLRIKGFTREFGVIFNLLGRLREEMRRSFEVYSRNPSTIGGSPRSKASGKPWTSILDNVYGKFFKYFNKNLTLDNILDNFVNILLKKLLMYNIIFIFQK